MSFQGDFTKQNTHFQLTMTALPSFSATSRLFTVDFFFFWSKSWMRITGQMQLMKSTPGATFMEPGTSQDTAPNLKMLRKLLVWPAPTNAVQTACLFDQAGKGLATYIKDLCLSCNLVWLGELHTKLAQTGAGIS